jgi:hypothetical protein
MQLVAYGAQDIYLTGSPMITFFKVVYRRHTNFASESIEQTINGTVGWNNRVTTTISRNGDLINGVVMEITIPLGVNSSNSGASPSYACWIRNVGHYIMQYAEVDIGGQQIDKHYSDWFEIWYQLTLPAEKTLGYRQMIGQDLIVNTAVSGGTIESEGLQNPLFHQATNSRLLYVPLQFWFCRNVGLSLPLIALQYHEVQIIIQFNPYSVCVTGDNVTSASGYTVPSLSVNMWVDYVYLDTDERRRFAQVSHEYLIEQVQYSGTNAVSGGTSSASIIMNFNHPCKELVWVFSANYFNNQDQNQQPANYTATVDWLFGANSVQTSGATSTLDNVVQPNQTAYPLNQVVYNAKIQLNGQDRFNARYGTYFNWVQPYQTHTCIPSSNGIYVYSFAIKPEDHQPSGTCNFSRIDNSRLVMTLGNGTTGLATPGSNTGGNIKIYAVNYNVLRIMSGMGGLAYSN